MGPQPQVGVLAVLKPTNNSRGLPRDTHYQFSIKTLLSKKERHKVPLAQAEVARLKCARACHKSRIDRLNLLGAFVSVSDGPFADTRQNTPPSKPQWMPGAISFFLSEKLAPRGSTRARQNGHVIHIYVHMFI